MKRLIATAGLLVVVPTFALAQNADHQYHAEGYAFAVCEANVGGVGAGGGYGGEVFIYKGLGLGGEFVKASPFGEDIISADVYLGMPSTKKNKFEPFVSGGYTHFSVGNLGPPPANGGNFGVGANVWLTKHAALRLEVRDTIGGRALSIEYEPYGNFYTSPNNVASFRIGVTFR